METIFLGKSLLIILLMSCEAHSNLSGLVNEQNCRYYVLENPRELPKRPLHSPKVTLWCTIEKAGVICPYLFEYHNGNAVTVSSELYTEMINNFIVPELRWKHIPVRCIWFQQYGAMPHAAIPSIDVVRPLFGDRLFYRFTGTPSCPPTSSPDLSMCDHFSWGKSQRTCVLS